MNLLSGLTDAPRQTISLPLADGSTASLAIEYRPNQLGWFFDVTWGDSFAVKGGKLVAFPNVLRQFREKIPFGLAVMGAGNIDPTDLESFINGSVSLYLLDAADVADVEAAVFVNSS